MITSAMLEKLLNIGWHDVGYGRVGCNQEPHTPVERSVVELSGRCTWKRNNGTMTKTTKAPETLSPLAKLFPVLYSAANSTPNSPASIAA